MSLKETIDRIMSDAYHKMFQAIKDDFEVNGITLIVPEFNEYNRSNTSLINYGGFERINLYGSYNGATFKIKLSKSGYTFYVDGLSNGSMGGEVLAKKLKKNLAAVDERKKILDNIFK